MRRLAPGQWGVLTMLLVAMGLEFVFSPYWHPWIQQNLVNKAGTGHQVYISNEGFLVVAFLLFTIFVLVLIEGAMPRAGLTVAALILLMVILARAQPIIDWMDATTTALKGASGA